MAYKFLFVFVVDILSRELKAKEGRLKLNYKKTCSKYKEEEEDNPHKH